MKGIYTLQLSTKRLSFKIDIKCKYTIIRGNSGTGKSTFADYILQYNQRGADSGVYLNCNISVKRFIDVESLALWDNCIVVVDEGDLIFKYEDVSSIFENSTCYFIIITRQKMDYLPYSLSEIYEFTSTSIKPKFTEVSLSNK